MEIRGTVKEDLPQINQLVADHPRSSVKAKTAAELHDRNRLLIVAMAKENRVIGFAQTDEQQSEERVDQRPTGELIQHILVTKEKTGEIQERFAEYSMLEVRKRKTESFSAQF